MIVNIRLFFRFPQRGVIYLLHNLLIGGLNLGGILLIYIITDNRIQGQPQRQQERHDRQSDCDTLLLRMEPSFENAPEE